MNHSSEQRTGMPFRPTLKGCVTQDHRMARGVAECYFGKLSSLAAYTYTGLMTERSDPALSDMLDAFAIEESEQFRMLGELILALGGNPCVRTQVRMTPMEWHEGGESKAVRQMLEEHIQSEKSMNDRLQTLMGRTEDRVVRSLLAYLISDGQRHIEHLRAAII